MASTTQLASDLGTSGRTLQRAVARGLVRADRRGGRRLTIPFAEEAYLRRHWERLLRPLVGSLRTEHGVDLAVLFGSVARGEEGPSSDLDLLVSVTADDPLYLAGLERRLGRAVDRNVQLTSMAEADAVLLAEVLVDGRVLVDRSSSWERLSRRRADVERDADQVLRGRPSDLAERLGLSG